LEAEQMEMYEQMVKAMEQQSPSMG
jgi:hypothetical protein